MKWHRVIFWVCLLVFTVMIVAFKTGYPLPVSVFTWFLFTGCTVMGIFITRRALKNWRSENQPALVVTILVTMAGTIILERSLEDIFLGNHPSGPAPKLVENALFMWPWLFIAMAIDLAEYSAEKKLEKSTAELMYLRHQLSPHFLLNTHNTINFLIEQNPQLASSTLLKLSGIMQYMLYECNADRVCLRQELSNLENYIGLEGIRKEHVDVSYKFSNPEQDYQIAPLLLITFVENAFKHVSTSGNHQNFITMHSSINNGTLHFEVINTTSERKPVNDGIGLANTKRRLQILYRRKHRLDIQEKEGLYSVHLAIQLDNT